MSSAYSSNGGREVGAPHACNFEAVHYLLFIYFLINCTLRNIGYIASNIGQFEMECLKNKLSLRNLPSVHIACLIV